MAVTETFDQAARQVTSELHTPNARIFWTDMLLTAVAAWTPFLAAIFLAQGIWGVAACLAAASAAFYRGLCFIHEISHLRPNTLRGFETVWNFLFGLPLLLPSFVYTGVHSDHHKAATYGTERDPEYLPFARSELMTAGFALHSLLIPLFLLLRFVLIAPFALLIPRLHRWLAAHASSLSMNLRYERNATPALMAKMRRWEPGAIALWGGALALAAAGALPWRAFLLWYAITAPIALVNALRTLGAHRYESSGASMTRAEQLLDSIDTPGAFWTELWAPVGLRYHALHHYFPGIPYHNLPEAYSRLMAALPENAPLREASSASLAASLAALYRTGQRARRGESSLIVADAERN